jgi:hypothetical protein
MTTVLSKGWSRFGSALAASACAIATLGCHGPAATSSNPKPVVVTLGECPADRESAAGKVHAEASLPVDPAATLTAMVVLRPLSQRVESCPGDASTDARCAVRDASLMERSSLNQQEWGCVGHEIAGNARLPQTTAIWYEVPYHLTTGQPVPIGTMVQLQMTREQVGRVAGHPFVERIEPPPGQGWSWGAGAPRPPDDCPKATDEPLAKLDRLTSIQGMGRQAAVIELRDDGFLPPQTDDAQWERTILNTRELACVRRWIDAQVKAVPPAVDYFVATGSVGGVVLPPFGQPTVTVKAFGIGLTWEEARGIAKHPYVEALWTASSLSIATPPDGCPPSFDTPVATVSCPDAREPLDGKLSAETRRALEASAGPQPVIVRVRGGATLCPLPQCPGPDQPCPERDKYTSRWQAENTESQRCVRDLITQLGGTSDPTVAWLTNFFGATLTWEQIQAVAAHPHVAGIDLGAGGTLNLGQSRVRTPPASSTPALEVPGLRVTLLNGAGVVHAVGARKRPRD